MYIKMGSKDADKVKIVQDVVGVTADGVWGSITDRAVRVWQKKNGLRPDGLVGPKTMEAMSIIDTDTQEQFYTTNNGLVIHRHFLPKGEYIEASVPFKNEYAFIHHTAGWNNPYKVIDSWGRDTRGRVATEFVLGGQKITNGNDDYDGIMVQAFPDGCQGWHLGKTGSSRMARHSVGLEVCNFGYLKDGKTYTKAKADKKQISKLPKAFKKYEQWHKYSDAQIAQMKLWIEFVAERDNIDLNQGLIPWVKKKGANAFDFNQDAYEGKVTGLLTHTNVRKDKSDCFPQPELIDMLLSF